LWRNSRSVGIEIANMGAYPVDGDNPFAEWYVKEPDGQVRITIPPQYGDGGIFSEPFVGHPARPEPVVGTIQGKELVQYDYTPQQYQALIKLTAALCKSLPQIKCEYPKDAAGNLIREKLPDAELKAYQGVLGHFHLQTDKADPGPALQWDYVISNARRLMDRGMSGPADDTSKGHLRPRL
jgi:N-acetylmuramoyl-L-alanine amidase